jgi:hypothetical protein
MVGGGGDVELMWRVVFFYSWGGPSSQIIRKIITGGTLRKIMIMIIISLLYFTQWRCCEGSQKTWDPRSSGQVRADVEAAAEKTRHSFHNPGCLIFSSLYLIAVRLARRPRPLAAPSQPPRSPLQDLRFIDQVNFELRHTNLEPPRPLDRLLLAPSSFLLLPFPTVRKSRPRQPKRSSYT